MAVLMTITQKKKVIVMIMSLKIRWVFQTLYDQRTLHGPHYCLRAIKHYHALYL